MISKQYKLIAGMLLLAGSASAGAFTINLDYGYDTNGFFPVASTQRSLMTAAASFFESRITDDLAAITSTGSNNMNAYFTNPATGGSETITDFNVAADTITVFVGGRSLASGTLGMGGYGGYSASGSQAFLDTVKRRGELGDVKGSTATEFSLWGGQISFNTDSNWYFDSDISTDNDIPAGQSDFYSVALHELGHVLGLGIADSWDNLAISNQFTGANSVAVYGGPVPLTSDDAHWDYGTMSVVDGSPQEAAMDPTLTVGTRKVFTDLDLAALDDIGWDVAASPIPLPPAVWLFGSGLAGILGLRMRRRRYA